MVQDVRAVEPGTNVKKPGFIVICKNGKEMEVQSKNVAKNLEKGATLGTCGSRTATTQERASRRGMTSDAATAGVQLLMYPNPVPSNGLLSLRFSKAEAVKVELLNLTGRIVKVLYQGNTPANGEIGVELGKAVKGSSVYMVKVTTSSAQLSYKLIVL